MTASPPGSPERAREVARSLFWRAATDHPQDHGKWVADGISGRYSAEKQKDGTWLLWWAHDNFVWEACATFAECKEKAEADWQRRFAERLATPTPCGIESGGFLGPVLSKRIAAFRNEAPPVAGGEGEVSTNVRRAYGPHHPDYPNAPADWNGRDVWLRCGSSLSTSDAASITWSHPYVTDGKATRGGDVVAYAADLGPASVSPTLSPPVARDRADLVNLVVEIAQRDIARTQTDFLGRMGQALCEYQGAFDEYPDGDLPDTDREVAIENIAGLAGLALAQLAMLTHPDAPTAALSPPSSIADDRMREALESAQFLCDRLDDLEWHDGALEDTLRDFMGHVDSALARLKSALASVSAEGRSDG